MFCNNVYIIFLIIRQLIYAEREKYTVGFKYWTVDEQLWSAENSRQKRIPSKSSRWDVCGYWLAAQWHVCVGHTVGIPLFY